MPKWLKIVLQLTAGFACLVLVLWFSVIAYIHINKRVVLEKITAELNSSINGSLTIEAMEPVILKGFPGISVALTNVVLRDSLWEHHKHDLLKAEEVFVSMDAVSLLKGTPTIRDIIVEKGNVYIYTDSSGYTNTSIFAKKADTTKKGSGVRLNRLKLNDVVLVFENRTKFKLFQMDIEDLAVKMNHGAKGWDATIKTNTLVRNLAFNTAKGSFIKNKRLDATLEIEYLSETQVLNIPLQSIMLNKDEVMLGGEFMLGNQPATFVLDIKALDIPFRNAISMLSPTISSKLNIVDFKKPLDVEASIKGRMKFRDTPLVVVKWEVRKNTLITPAGAIEDCAFKGVFENEVAGGRGHNDRNSRITVYGFKGSWETIPFKVDTAYVTNLVSPVIEGRFTSNFPLAKLNAIIGGKSFAFKKGTADLNLHYKGGLSPTDTNKAYVYGAVKVKNADISYLPRELKFTNSAATVNFRGRDVFVQNVTLQGGATVLKMEGSLLNFLSLYYTDPRKMVLDWRIHSEQVDLLNFIAFLGTRKKTGETPVDKSGSGVSRMSAQLDKVMDASTVHLNLKVGKVSYYTFNAQNLDADISLKEAGLVLNHVKVSHAGGTLAVSGAIEQKSTTNSFKVKADVKGVNVQEFFQSFQNFGQDAITDKNLQGSVFATADVTGSITDKGKMVPNSLNGFVTFDLKNGMLRNFAPFQKIGKFVFRNRDLSNVAINKLENRLDIQGDKIIIHPMYIESSAINLQIDGVYGLNKGTDINIDVPLRNPKKDELVVNDSSRMERGMKGLVVHLKAVDGDDGNVKIKLLAREEKGRRKKKRETKDPKEDTP